MKTAKSLIFVFMSIHIFTAQANADMTYYKLAEICQTQISFDAEISISDSRYVDLEDHPTATAWAAKVFLSSANNHEGQIFDCEDIALNAKIRFIMAMGEHLIPQGEIYAGIPVGTLIFGNGLEAHMVNIIIYQRTPIIYDIGHQKIWTLGDIEDAGHEITEIRF